MSSCFTEMAQLQWVPLRVLFRHTASSSLSGFSFRGFTENYIRKDSALKTWFSRLAEISPGEDFPDRKSVVA